MSVSAAQVPTYELISAIALENLALAAHLGVSSRKPVGVTTRETQRQVTGNVKNVLTFLGPIQFPDFPSQWD